MFLSACDFLQSHIFKFADACSALYRLTSKDVPFVWTRSCDDAFRTLKNKVVTAACLAYPNFSGKFSFLLQFDASNDCVGSVLLQEGTDGAMHSVHFLSYRFEKQAQSWHISEKECFAIVFSVMKLRYYLLGAHFVIETDHKNFPNLSWVLSQTSNSRLTRWAIMLADMDFTVRAKKGTEIAVADALSRLPSAQVQVRRSSRASAIEAKQDAPESCSDKQRKSFHKNPPSSVNDHKEELKSLKAKICRLGTIFWRRSVRISVCSSGSVDSRNPVPTLRNSDGKRAKGREFQLQEPDGLSVYSSPKHPGVRVVIPPKLRVKGFLHFHLLCQHASFKKCCSLIASKFYWLGIYDDTKQFCRRCIVCLSIRQSTAAFEARLATNFPLLRVLPFQILVYDIFGPSPITVTGFRCILVVMGKFTRWVELISAAAGGYSR